MSLLNSLLTETGGVPSDFNISSAGSTHTFNIPDGGVVEGQYSEEESLTNAKSAKIKEIKAWRDAELIKPTPQTVNSYDDDDAPNIGNHSFKFASEDMSLLANILDKLKRLPNGRTRKWTSITGERVALTKSDFQSILDHLEARDESLFDIAQMNIDIVNELTSVKEVEDFEITFE